MKRLLVIRSVLLVAVFDYCQNLEFSSQDPATTEGSLAESLAKRLFKARLELISELDQKLRDVLKEGQ